MNAKNLWKRAEEAIETQVSKHPTADYFDITLYANEVTLTVLHEVCELASGNGIQASWIIKENEYSEDRTRHYVLQFRF